MSLTPPNPLEIRQVSNGFLVTPVPCSYSRGRGDVVGEPTEQRVFQTMAALAQHLQDHFDHRTAFVATDPTPIIEPLRIPT